ncbi:MAG: transposase family protein [Opitutales bacterium]|nr:transposase family protein [Opitutales bacterium]
MWEEISMVEQDGDFVALAETTVFLSYFKEMPDHRQQDKVLYPLDEVLLLCLLAVLAGAKTFTYIASRLYAPRSDQWPVSPDGWVLRDAGAA